MAILLFFIFVTGWTMLTLEDIHGFGAKVSEAIDSVVEDYVDGDAVHENPFSGQLTGRIKEALRQFETPRIRWQVASASEDKGKARLRARQLTSQGFDTEESRFGADIIFCLDIVLSDYNVKKGFLVQSKRLEPGELLDKKTADDLRRQCSKMLAVTPASMVFLYSKTGVHAVPATAVAASTTYDIYGLETYDIQILFNDFAMCWFGDPLLQATDPASLERLRALAEAREALLFKGDPLKP
jgi:hypothetical protein